MPFKPSRNALQVNKIKLKLRKQIYVKMNDESIIEGCMGPGSFGFIEIQDFMRVCNPYYQICINIIAIQ